MPDRSHEQIATHAPPATWSADRRRRADGVGSLKAHAAPCCGESRQGPPPSAAQAASTAARGSTARRISARVIEEAFVDAGVQMPGQPSASNMFQAARSAHDGPDPRLGVSRPLAPASSRSPQHRPRHTEHRGELGIARHPRPLRVATSDDVDTDRTGDFGVIGMRSFGRETRCARS